MGKNNNYIYLLKKELSLRLRLLNYINSKKS